MEEEISRAGYHPADTNGDGRVDDVEREMYLEFKRKELEDQDAQRDSMRKMAWFALWGMLLYPASILVTSVLGQDKAATIIGDIAPTYFVAISALVAAFFGANAYSNSKKPPAPPALTPPPRTFSTPTKPAPKGPAQEQGEEL
jgi:hypothetical protein